MLVFGILLIVKGLISLIDGIKRKKALDIIFAILTLAVGVVIAVYKTGVIGWVTIVIGVLLIVDGVLGLVAALTSKR